MIYNLVNKTDLNLRIRQDSDASVTTITVEEIGTDTLLAREEAAFSAGWRKSALHQNSWDQRTIDHYFGNYKKDTP